MSSLELSVTLDAKISISRHGRETRLVYTKSCIIQFLFDKKFNFLTKPNLFLKNILWTNVYMRIFVHAVKTNLPQKLSATFDA